MEKDHTSSKEDAFINAAAADVITREEQSIDGENISFDNKFSNSNILPVVIFSLNYVFVVKVQKVFVFLKKVSFYEKR